MISRILVTGGRGFIGRYVVAQLIEAGYKVRVVDNLSAPGSCDGAPSDHEFIEADLRDKSATLRVFEDVDVCIALAARSSGIGFFNKHPAEMLHDNVQITSNTFEAARIHQINRVIYVSSSCVYDNSAAYPIVESALDSSPPPSPGYPFSKLIGEHYCEVYIRQYGLRYTIVRPFNAYGVGEMPGGEPGDSHVIPDLAAKILKGQYPLEIFGDGQQTRSFTNVKDIAGGILLAMESPTAINEDFNLGHPSEVKIIDLAGMLWSICARKERFAVKSVTTYEHDVRRRAVNISKARTMLGWEPMVDLKDGLAEVIAWLAPRLGVALG